MPTDTTLTATSGTWLAERDLVRAAGLAPVLAQLDELGVIEAHGPEAVAFLQTQLTNDLEHLVVGQMQMNGYCTPKGRLLAVVDCWRNAESVFLQLPRSGWRYGRFPFSPLPGRHLHGPHPFSPEAFSLIREKQKRSNPR